MKNDIEYEEDDRLFSADNMEEFAKRMVLYALDNATSKTPTQLMEYISDEVRFEDGDGSYNTYPMPERENP